MRLRRSAEKQANQAVEVPSGMEYASVEGAAHHLQDLIAAGYTFPGFSTGVDNGRAFVCKSSKPHVGERVAVYCRDGVWNVECQDWRPGTEVQDQGTIRRTTTTLPVSALHPISYSQDVCRLEEGGGLTAIATPTVHIGDPMPPEMAAAMATSLWGVAAIARPPQA